MKKAPVFVALGLAAITLSVFLPVIRFDFVNWDDEHYVSRNVDILSLRPDHLKALVSKPFVGHWAPVPMLTYAVERAFYHNSASGFHATNLLLHLVNVLLLFWLLRRLTGSDWAAGISALVFAIHPAQVESVAWISERKNLLFALFLFASFGLFWSRRKPTAARNALIVLLWALAAGSKTLAVVIPFVVLLGNRFDDDRIRRDSKTLRAFAALVIMGLGAEALFVYRHVFILLLSGPMGNPLVQGFMSFGRYLSMLVAPYHLRLFYFDGVRDIALNELRIVPLAVGLTSVFFFAWLFLKKKAAGFWLGWILLFLVPVSGFFLVPENNRHLYLPLAAAGPLALTLAGQRFRKSAGVLLLVACASWIIPARAEINRWKNSEALWESVLKQDPTSHIALMQLADYYRLRNDRQHFDQVYARSVALYPKDWEIYSDAVTYYMENGYPKEAQATADAAQRALGLTPEVWNIRAIAAHAVRDPIGVLKNLEKAAEGGIRNPSVYLNLTSIYLSQNDTARAAAVVEKFSKVDPESPDIFFIKGLIAEKTKMPGLAAEHYQKAIDHGCINPNAYCRLGILRLAQRNPRAARLLFEKALRLQPDLAPARRGLELAKTK